MRIISTLFLVMFTFFLGYAQQAPQYSLYMLNRYQFNPAFAGMDASLSINGAYRTQWVGIPGNPVQQNINAHMPFYLLNGALGIQLQNESIGAEKSVSVGLSYNYVYESNIGLFSAGASLGLIQKSLDGTKLLAPEGEYEGPIINHMDGNLPNGLVRGIAPTFNAGVYFAGDYFEAGVAFNDYSPTNINLGDNITFKPSPTANFFFEYYIEYFDEVNIYPTIFVKSDFKQTQIELNVRAEYQDNLMAGIGFRGYNQNTIDAINLFAGFKLSPKLFMAYGYDLTLSALDVANTGTHEIILKYNLGKIIGAGLPPRVIYNPRLID